MHDDPVPPDPEPPGWFAGHLVRTLTGGALTMLISLGYRTGLFEAAAAGPGRRAGPGAANQPNATHAPGAVPGLPARLAAGVDVLDLGCGTGHAVTVAARAFPASRIVGVDIDEHAVVTAQGGRARLGLRNATFVIGDAAALRLARGST